ncbi:MAG: hypothetical protein ACXVIO_10845, partial [Candidatus Angelobacter sp.]
PSIAIQTVRRPAVITHLHTPPSTTDSLSGQDDSRTQWVGADSILFATAHRPWPAPWRRGS